MKEAIAVVLFLLGAGLLAAAVVASLRARKIERACQRRDLFSKMIFETSNEAIILTDADNRIVDANPAFTTITGYERQEALGKDPGFMKSGKHEAEFYRAFWAELLEAGRWQGEVWDRRKSGELYAKWLSASVLKDAKGKAVNFVGIFSDITPMKETEEYHDFLSHYDPLTRLPNRKLFTDRLDMAMKRALEEGRKAAVLIVNLFEFKGINDTLGHSVGDAVLKTISERLSQTVRKSDTVARLGGDEFGIILEALDSERAAASMAQKIIKALMQPTRHAQHELHISSSIGIALFPADADRKDQLLQSAGMALEQAKRLGRDKFQFFTPEMHKKAQERVHVESNLRMALERNEMVLHYQPLLDLHTGRVCGMEALIRRQEAEWLVPPGVFIPVAEETGLIIPLAEWTLREACRQVRQWRDAGLPPLRVAVNISAHQFKLPDFVDSVSATLKEAGVDPSALEIELTERVVMDKAEEVLSKMKRLKDMGIHISIDDFGTGYSSLIYLQRFPINKLKIDYSFVKDLKFGSQSAAIVRTIISLAHNLNLKVIAEGVEKQEQMDFLKEEGCDEIQGFLYSFPLPADKFEAFLRQAGQS